MNDDQGQADAGEPVDAELVTCFFCQGTLDVERFEAGMFCAYICRDCQRAGKKLAEVFARRLGIRHVR